MVENTIMVYVSCPTFNQAQYINDTLNGFCIQQTDFPFVCGIIDDASTDGEPQVIQRYLEENFNLQDENVVQKDETDDYTRIFAQHKTNKNCYFVVFYLKYNHFQIKKTIEPYIIKWSENAKYKAICEGDDYWIGSMRLQQQVNFMEAHPNHSMIFNAVQYLYPDGHREEIRRYDKDMEQCPVSDLILGGGGFIRVNSMLYKQEFKKNYPDWAKNCPVGDSPLFLVLAVRGGVAYFNTIGSCYRINSVGSWTSRRYKRTYKQRFLDMIDNIKYWNTFDKWTKREYHKYVIKKDINDIINFIEYTILCIIGRNK